MAYYPSKIKVKTEIQESVNEMELSCDHLTTADFFETNVAYVRDNTTRESFTNNTGVFARPVPMQLPVMGKAQLKLKSFFIPYRTISLQWHDFITRSPHTPANGLIPIIVQEMPYFIMPTLVDLFSLNDYSTPGTATNWDWKDQGGQPKIFTAKGRHAYKILCQLGYKVAWGSKENKKWRHINANRILCFAKAYLDYYYSNQYQVLTAVSYNVEQLFKKDAATPYELTFQDFDNIFELTRYTFYEEDYFVAAWDNPTSPNIVNTSFGNIQINDITMPYQANQMVEGYISNSNDDNENPYRTPWAATSEATASGQNRITQYLIDSLKAVTDYVKRYQLSGVKAIDRYLARFGVLLTAEKLMRSEFYGTQTTNMQMGAIYSTAETDNGNLGDYGGQGVINSDGQEHKTFEYEDLKDMGCIMQIFTITPKIGYFQGIDRENLRTDPESYFNGIYDQLGTQATSAAEVYLSMDGTSWYSKEDQLNAIFGYMPRQAHRKLPLDKLTGDFCIRTLNNNTLKSPWHMFRVFDDSQFDPNGGGVTHNPWFVKANDAEQYLRIFNATTQESGDHFIVYLQQKNTAKMHAKPIYDTYDFDSEGKEIIMKSMGAVEN